ncbi:MAG: type II CAAX endopeptidase family protein [Planctomycetota bacterium]
MNTRTVSTHHAATPPQRTNRTRNAAAILIVTLLLPLFVAPPIAGLVDRPVASVVTRMLMIGSIISLIVFIGPQMFGGVKSWWRQDAKRSLRSFLTSYVVTLFLCSAFVTIMLWAGHMILRRDDPGPIAAKFLSYAMSGLCVGLIEEWVFRGLMWRRLSARIGLIWGAISVSAIYSWVHFLRPPKVPSVDPTMADVVAVYQTILQKLVGPIVTPTLQAWSQFVGLFLFGVLLIVLVQRSGRLAAAIGVHAAVVFFLKGDGKIIHYRHRDYDWILGSRHYYDGVIAWGVLLLIIVWLWKPWRAKPAPQTTPSETGTAALQPVPVNDEAS